jgi:Ni,Fe-hydrogenase maturation factor
MYNSPMPHAPAFLICQKPIDILQHASPSAPAFFIDTLVSELSIGTLRAFDYPFTTVEHRSQFVSTHGYSILDTLRLAIPLDRICPCSSLIAINVGRFRQDLSTQLIDASTTNVHRYLLSHRCFSSDQHAS